MELIKKNKTIFTCLVLFVMSFAVFIPSLQNDFVWDDQVLIERSVNKFESRDISKLFFPEINPNSRMVYFRPAIIFSFIKDYQIWEKNAFGFHLTNNLIFAVNVLLVFILFSLLLKTLKVKFHYLIASLGSVFFALHPIHVETVSWISGRTDLLCGMFLTLALIFHLKIKDSLFFIPLSIAGFILSLYSKETAVVFPFLVLFIDLISGKRRKYLYISYVLYLAVLFYYFNIRTFPIADLNIAKGFSFALASNSFLLTDFSIVDLFLDGLKAVYFYISKLLVPLNLNVFISELPSGVLYIISSLVIFISLIGLFLYSVFKSLRVVSICIVWILLTLAPSLVIVFTDFVPSPVAERYLYIPSVGFCLLLSYLITKIYERKDIRLISIAFAIFFTLFFGYLTLDRQSVWKNNLSLWKDASQKSFNYALPHVNYGLALEEVGKTEEAKKEYFLALNLDVKDSSRGRASTANKLAIIYFNEGNDLKGLKLLDRALEYDSRYVRTYYHFGLYYYVRAKDSGSKKDYRTGVKYLKDALKRTKGKYPKANLLLSKTYLELNKFKKAKKFAKKALRQSLKDNLILEANEVIRISDKSHNNNPQKN